jgi:hypothetical protein
MNNILQKFMCAFLIISAIKCSAKGGTFDTTLLAGNNLNTAGTIIKEANVIYPSAIQQHKEASLAYTQKYSNTKREFITKMHQKGKNYFPKVISVFKKYNLPQELKVLLALESGFNANAVSSAGAVGYWQMMADAATDYGLKIITAADLINNTNKKDDRTNFNKSTVAAARFFRDGAKLYNNDILLMVAAYNCGNGNIRKALKKSGKANADFWDIKKYLPAETRNYVMNFIALSVVFENYDNFKKNELIFNTEYIKIPSVEKATIL